MARVNQNQDTACHFSSSFSEVILKSIVDDSEGSVSAHDFLEERIRAIKLY